MCWTTARCRPRACPRASPAGLSGRSYGATKRPRWRCCTNRHGTARCPPTGSSPADAVRHWSAEGGHPIQDLSAKDGLTPLPSWTPGAKTIADDGRVAEERVLHPALTMVPCRLFPAAPAELLHHRDRPIPRGRPRAVARDVRRPGRGDDDCRTPRPRGFVDGDRVRGRISGDAHERTIDGVDQIEGGGRIITRRPGQRVDKDRAGLIDAKVKLPPATPAAATVFRGRPLPCPDEGQPRAVEHEMEALAGRDRRSQTAPQMLTAPGKRRIVGGGEVEAHHPEQGVQEPFGLAQRGMGGYVCFVLCAKTA